ncbi:MAG: MBL fold metallo-hydrolase [Terrimicrobiaceae bacterium]|nr:MBL fold metallo-hydrolase [Terrimicrobiaceae bacterium]
MLLRQIFDPQLAQYAYLVGCQRTGEALLIDPERDIDRYQSLATENGLRITAVAETHIHADFVSGGREFAQDPDVRLYLSAEGGPDWLYQWPGQRPNTHFLEDGDHFMVGNIRIDAVHTPGHTPEHLSFLITDIGGGADRPIALATGDFVFVGDVGRPDLLESAAGVKGAMEPSARKLRESLRDRLLPFLDYLQILPAHGAGSACGKALGAVPTTTLGYERRFNAPLKLAMTDGEAFVKDILSGQPESPLYFATMKRVNRDGIAVTGGAPTPPHLEAAEFSRKAGDPAVRILDARGDREAFDLAHVTRAIHAPLHSPFFSTSAGSYLTENAPILLVLERPEDADLAARQLYRIGFDGIAGWITVEEAKAAGVLSERLDRMDFREFDPARALQQGEIIDVRTTGEYQRGHLDGARSFPYTRLKTRLADLPKDRRLFIHCGTGKRASLAASFLRSEGFDAVHIDGVCAECERIATAEGVTH